MKALVILSGGQDSTSCLFWAIKKYKQVTAIGFDYGQRHIAELDCAKEICKKADIKFDILSLKYPKELSPNSLTNDIPLETSSTVPNSLVEGRNMLFLTYAAIYAKARDINTIIIGVSQTDFSGYPDCRDIFIKSCNVTLNLAFDYNFFIETPLMLLDKSQVWALSDKLGVMDIIKHETLTCYNGIKKGCGECPSCLLREKGLNEYVRNKKNI